MTVDSLQKRYLVKLVANIIGILISMVTQIIIPRGLGPVNYGNFSFLTDTFNKIISFLDLGGIQGFYTKLCQRQSEFGLVSFYFSFSSLVSLFLLGAVFGFQLTGTYTFLFPGQELNFIYLGAFWAILTWLVQILNRMIDAYGVTVNGEIARIIQKTLGLGIIALLFHLGQLSLTHFFFYHYTIMIFLAISFIWIMENKGFSFVQSWKISYVKLKAYLKEYYAFCYPLFLMAVISLVAGVFDRWMLQKFGGSIEQGFYGLSYQIGIICFLFSSAMSPLITREFSIAFFNNDLKEMARLFRRYLPMLYAIAAYFACFIAVEAEEVALIMGGKKFEHASLAIMIMAFYPIHQTYGQLSGAVFYATGRTKIVSNISITFLLIGLPLIYFLLAPKAMMGLNTGATGLAIKMVVIQFIAVNVQLYHNTSLLKLRFSRYLIHQIGAVMILFGFAYISHQVISLGWWPSHLVIDFIATGFLYSVLVAVSLLIIPQIFGLQKRDLLALKQLIHR